jgi:hypothetical protein
MAKTSAQSEAEKWIREVELPRLFKQKFSRQTLLLQSGGRYTFETVSEDSDIVVLISTSRGITSSGKQALDNLQEIRKDVLWILMIEQQPSKMLLAITDPSMIKLIKEEKKKDRFPKEIEIVRIKLPKDLEQKVSDGYSEEEPS